MGLPFEDDIFPDATKQAQEIIFSHKASATITELIILTMHQ